MGAERWRHRTDHPESAPAFRRKQKQKKTMIFGDFHLEERRLLFISSRPTRIIISVKHTESSDGVFSF